MKESPYDVARCAHCGGRIKRCHGPGDPNTGWFHETVSPDDKRLDIREWLDNPKQRHKAIPEKTAEQE